MHGYVEEQFTYMRVHVWGGILQQGIDGGKDPVDTLSHCGIMRLVRVSLFLSVLAVKGRCRRSSRTEAMVRYVNSTAIMSAINYWRENGIVFEKSLWAMGCV